MNTNESGDFDQELQALLRESDSEAEELAALQGRVKEAFNVALELEGYEPLVQGSDRYRSTHDVIEGDIRQLLAEQHGALPDNDVVNARIRNAAEIRVMEMANVEAFVMEVARGHGELIEIAYLSGDQERLLKEIATAEEAKRTVYANLMMRRKYIQADNPVVRAMVAFLPGGNIADDDSMIEYYAVSMAGMAEATENNSRMSAIIKKVQLSVGFDAEVVRSESGITPKERDVATLVQAGYMLTRYSQAERESRLYELAGTSCEVLTPQNIHDVIAVINQEIPVNRDR